MVFDISYTTPKQAKLLNIDHLSKEYSDSIHLMKQDLETQHPDNFEILTDYYDNLIEYYATNPTLLDAYFLSQYSDTLITIFDVLNKKIFKGGFDLVPLVDNPNEGQKELIERYLTYANSNGESLLQVLKEVELRANWSNLRCVLLLNNYSVVGSELKVKELREIQSIDPLTLQPMKDKKGRLGYDKGGNKIYVAVDKRGAWSYDERDENGTPLLSADYRINTTTGYVYFSKEELIVNKKFPFNPLYALKNKVLALIEQDKYIMKEYSEGKPSKKLMIAKGKNLDEVRKSLKEYSNAVREYPNKQHMLMFGGIENNQNIMEVVDLVKSLDEMQFTDMRHEFRNAIGAPYGVSPVYQNDTSTGGGLNNEGLQITVTNEAIESNKDEYNQLLKFIFNTIIGITDYEIKLFPNEEEDLAHKEDLLMKKLLNAEKLVNMGLKVKFDAGSQTVIYEDGDLEVPIQASSFGEGMGNNSQSLRNINENVTKEDKKKKELKTPLMELIDEYTKEFENQFEDHGHD